MAITDIEISEELMTNAPSIKYSGNEGPKSPQEQQMMMEQMMMAQLEEEYSKYVDDAIEQGIEPMTLQQFMEQAMAEARQPAAYGGIMGMDGRKQYGIGSFFQKAKDKFVDDIIPNEIKDNPVATALAAAYGLDTFGIPGTNIGGNKVTNKILGDIFSKAKNKLMPTVAGGTQQDQQDPQTPLHRAELTKFRNSCQRFANCS